MPQQPQHNKFIALNYRDFRLLWVGLLVSNIGSQMQIVALNWHIYILTDSPVALGLIGLARFVPLVFFSLIGGSFADAHNRKRIMTVTQITLALLAAVLAVTTLTNTVNPFIIYTVTIASAIAVAFDMPSRQALIPSLIKREHLSNAISLNTIMWHIAMIIGPSIAGFVIAQFGVGGVYVFDSVSFIFVLMTLFLMHNNGEVKGDATIISLQSVKEGLHFVLTKTMIWSTMLLDFFATFFASATALIPIFAKDILHVGPQGLGFMYAAPAVGAVIAGYVIAHIGELQKQGRILLISVGFYALGTLLFGISKLYWLSLVGLFIVGAGDGISAIIRNTIRQLSTPDNLRGRMTSINMIFFMGGPQLGEFEAGLLAAFVGAPMAVVTGGVGTLVVVGLMALFIPTLRRYDRHIDNPLS